MTGDLMTPPIQFSRKTLRTLYLLLVLLLATLGLTACGGTTDSVEPKSTVANFSISADAKASVAVTFDGSSSTSSDNTTLNYEWDFGDESENIFTALASHTYVEPGVYTVVLTVTDNTGKVSTYERVITVTAKPDPNTGNQSPTATFTVPESIFSGSVIQFDASASTDPDDSISKYSWDFGENSSTEGMNPSHVYNAIGEYQVTLTVEDNEGATDSFTTTISVLSPPIDPNNQSPLAFFHHTAVTVYETRFNASSSSDSDGEIAQYSWTFGDGSTGEGENITHQYTLGGEYSVVLTVTDDKGASTSLSKNIEIEGVNQAPTALFAASVDEQLLVTLDASESTDIDGDISEYIWWLDDNTVLSGKNTSHTFSTLGDHSIFLYVRDDDGMKSLTYSDQITIEASNTNPIADFSHQLTTGRNINFDGAASHDSGGPITQYQWNFGDGTTAQGVNPNHTYTQDGNYTVTLTVTDNKNTTGSITKNINIVRVNTPPVAAFTLKSSSARAPTIATLNASSSNDSDGNISSYSWNFGDGSATGNGVSTSHTYSSQGTYTVTLTVIDNDGVASSSNRSITVQGPNQVPVSSFTSSSQAAMAATLNASSSNDSDGYISSYHWNFGDGTSSIETSSSVSHTFPATGGYNVSLIVVDNEGLQSSPTNKTVQVSAAPSKIVIIGDSISQGNTGNPSFRYPLWKHLIDSGKAFDFVGSLTALYSGSACSQTDCPDYSSSSFDQQHESIWGITTENANSYLSGVLPALNADIAIIHLGTNDILQGQGASNALADLQTTISLVRTMNPNVKIAIAKIIPVETSRGLDNEITTLNNLIAGLADSSIVVVDQHTGFYSDSHTYDGIHPNQAGENLMAQRWFDAIYPWL